MENKESVISDLSTALEEVAKIKIVIENAMSFLEWTRSISK